MSLASNLNPNASPSSQIASGYDPRMEAGYKYSQPQYMSVDPWSLYSSRDWGNTQQQTSNNNGDVLGAGTGPVNQPTPQPNQAPNPTNNNNNNNANVDTRSQTEKLLDEWGSKWNQFFGEMKSTLTGQANRQIQNVEKSGEKQINRTKEDQMDTLKGLDTDETRAMTTLDSATNDAIRAYNALAQQGRSRFGLGSSAGAAVGELARKEFFRQQGNIASKRSDTQLEFTKQRDSLAKFVRNKISDIEDWVNTSVQGIEDELVASIKDVEGKKMQSEQARDEAKLSLLQQAVSEAKAKQENANQMMQNLFLGYINNLQTIQQRVFTPKEIQVAYEEFKTMLPEGLNFAVDLNNQTPSVNFNPNVAYGEDEEEILP